jgi:hypothetical protein
VTASTRFVLKQCRAAFRQQLTAMRFDVIRVKHRWPFTAQQCLQPCFPLVQWQRSQVFAIQEEQIERKEHTLPAAEQQVIEHRTARVIDAGYLAIEHGTLDANPSIFSSKM